MNHEITIKETDGKLTANVSDTMSWFDILQMLVSTLSYFADKTVDILSAEPNLKSSHREEIAADVADSINFAVSNVLDKLSPKDPDLELTSVAIATMENQIIHEAANRKVPLADVLKEYESRLESSPYAAKPFGQNRREGVNVACSKKSKSKKSCGGNGKCGK